jgi:hypothetical protein
MRTYRNICTGRDNYYRQLLPSLARDHTDLISQTNRNSRTAKDVELASTVFSCMFPARPVFTTYMTRGKRDLVFNDKSRGDQTIPLAHGQSVLLFAARQSAVIPTNALRT